MSSSSLLLDSKITALGTIKRSSFCQVAVSMTIDTHKLHDKSRDCNENCLTVAMRIANPLLRVTYIPTYVHTYIHTYMRTLYALIQVKLVEITREVAFLYRWPLRQVPL